MNYIKSLLLIAVLAVAASCTDDTSSVDFGLDTTAIKVGPEGGLKSIRVSADKSWTASTDKHWILISPANGDASTECKIRIDSTRLDRPDKGVVTFSVEGQERKIEITRDGFPVQITVPDGSQKISLPDYADTENAYFDVDVTANVPFTVQIPEQATWLRVQEYKQAPIVGYLPRKTRIRFLWDINSKPFEQMADITFKPEIPVAHQDGINVVQNAAPVITPSRAGDSTSILAIARNLKLWSTGFDSSKSMMYWDNVELWDKEDTKAKEDPSLVGRVKFVKFYIFNTKMSVPYEVKYLTAVDSMVFFSNENRMIRDIELGPEICELTQLRSLSIVSYGLNKLPAEFTNLKNLESLSIGSNNFQTLPLDVINKENFPKLRKLDFNYMRTAEVYDLSNNVNPKIGCGGAFPMELLLWENLEYLSINFAYFEGSIPNMSGYEKKYTADDEAVKKGLTEVGVPKILPNVKSFRINGNRLSGVLPEWILKHPNLYKWEPYIFVFSQEGKDSNGNKAGFINEPDSVDPPQEN